MTYFLYSATTQLTVWSRAGNLKIWRELEICQLVSCALDESLAVGVGDTVSMDSETSSAVEDLYDTGGGAYPVSKPVFMDQRPLPPPRSHAKTCGLCHQYIDRGIVDGVSSPSHQCETEACVCFANCPTLYLRGK